MYVCDTLFLLSRRVRYQLLAYLGNTPAVTHLQYTQDGTYCWWWGLDTTTGAHHSSQGDTEAGPHTTTVTHERGDQGGRVHQFGEPLSSAIAQASTKERRCTKFCIMTSVYFVVSLLPSPF